MKKVIKTDLAPKAIGPYSQGIVVDGFLFSSGQIAIDPAEGKMVEGGIEKQATQVMENIKNMLKAAEMDFSNVIKTTIFLKDINDFATVNQIYANYFEQDPPARSCFQVANLPAGALIEIEFVAHK
jgi:2-iminobutanoate/2-iminopropanoate deaminase